MKNVNKKIVALIGTVTALLVATTSTARADSASLRMPGAHWRADYGPGGARVRGEVGSGDYRLRYDSYGGPYDHYGYGYSPFDGPVGGYYAPPMGIMGGYGPPLGLSGTVVFRPDITAFPSPQGEYTLRVVNNLPIGVRVESRDPIHGQGRGTACVSNNATSPFYGLRGPCVLQVRDRQNGAPIGRALLVDRPGDLIIEGGGSSGFAPPPMYDPGYSGGMMTGTTYTPTPPAYTGGGVSPSLLAALEDFCKTLDQGLILSPAQAERLLVELLTSGIDVPSEIIDLLVELAAGL